MRNRTRTTIAALSIAALSLTGCAATDDPAPEPTETATVQPEPDVVTPAPEGTYDPGPQVIGPPPVEESPEYQLTETDRLYLLDVRLQAPNHVETDEDLVAAAFLVCLAYEINRDLGVPDSETRAELMADLTADEAQLMAAVDAAATHHYCPAGGAA